MDDWRVTLTEIELPESDIEAVMETLSSGWLTMGPRTLDLEKAFAEYTGAEHAVAVSSCSAALHLACLACDLGPGDEVIVPAMSFVADAHSPRLAGGETVLADIRSVDEPLIDPKLVERMITDRTKAIIAVHMFGYPADLDSLSALCAKHDLALIEDCAENAGGTLRDGSKAGTRGLAGCFSFFSKTQLGVGEGGILITDDAEYAARVRSLRSHAMTSVTWDRHRGHAETYDVTELGFNYRIDEPRARLAIERLGRLDRSLSEMRRVASSYRAHLEEVEGLEVPFPADWVDLSGHFAFPVLVADREARDSVREAMRADGVQSTFYPSLSQLSEYESAAGSTSNAEEFSDRHLALPFSATMGEEKIEIVVKALTDALAGLASPAS